MSLFSPVAFKLPYPGMEQFMQLLVARNSPWQRASACTRAGADVSRWALTVPHLLVCRARRLIRLVGLGSGRALLISASGWRASTLIVARRTAIGQRRAARVV